MLILGKNQYVLAQVRTEDPVRVKQTFNSHYMTTPRKLFKTLFLLLSLFIEYRKRRLMSCKKYYRSFYALAYLKII